MELWWNSLGAALQLYYAIAFAASTLLLLQLLLTMVGFDGDDDMDFDAEVHDFGGYLSLRSLTAFFAGFGWGGVVAIRGGMSVLGSAAVAVATGGVLMASVVALMRGLYSMRASGTLDYSNAIGEVGNVYLPIPPNMEGPGQVEVLVQGRLAVVQAFTRAGHRLPNRSRVRVTETLDQQTIVVEPLGGAASATAAPAAEPPDTAVSDTATPGTGAPKTSETDTPDTHSPKES